MFLVTYFLSLPEFVFYLGQQKRKQCARRQTSKRQKQGAHCRWVFTRVR